MTIFLIFIEIAVLWLLARWVIQSIFTFLVLLFPSRPLAVAVISAALFPGTVIHELSHLFTAEILGVKTGKLDLVPDHIESEEIKAGSVTFSATDPLRRSLIGVAPLFTGLIAVSVLSWLLSTSISEVYKAFNTDSFFSHPSLYVAFGGIYLLFAVSNTMIPSKVDLKGTPLVFGIILFLATCFYIVGLRFTLTGGAQDFTNLLVSAILQNLTLVVSLNLVILALMQSNIYIMTRLLGIRLVKRKSKK